MAEYQYGPLHYTVVADVYKPAEDTFLLGKILERESPRGRIVEVGTGCGLLSLISAQTAQQVVATDISPLAAKNAKENARANRLDNKIEVLRGDLASALKSTNEFSTVIFNPPYLPVEERSEWIDKSWSGGPTGVEVVRKLFNEVGSLLKRHGSVYFLVSGGSRLEELRNHVQSKGFTTTVLDSISFFYEKVVAVRADRIA